MFVILFDFILTLKLRWTEKCFKSSSKMSSPGFWDNQERAKSIVTELSMLKAIIEPIQELHRQVEDLQELFDMAAGNSDEMILLEEELSVLKAKCLKIELQGLLSRPHDTKNCFISIHAGAGGTESCDWANMLLRMYTRYFETQKYKFEELDLVAGEEAGIRSVTLRG